MDAERHGRVRAAMADAGLDALVCRLPENVLFLTGYWPLTGISWVLFPRDGAPSCIVPDCEEAEARDAMADAAAGLVTMRTYAYGTLAAGDARAAVVVALRDAARGRRLRRVGFEGSFDTVAPPGNAGEPVTASRFTEGVVERLSGRGALRDATEVLAALRVRKTPAEADRVRRANEIARFGLQAFREAVAPGRTGLELAAAVETAVVLKGTGHRGARRVRAFAQVATGAGETSGGWRPMEISTRRALAPGDLALLELGVVADGYWSDRTRVRAAGEPQPRHRDILAHVRSAQEAAIAAVRPGAAASAVDAAARSVLESAGLGKEFLHITGHGTGFRYHEPGSFLAPGSPTRLEEGMIFSVEPGVYSPGFGGLRLEDDVLVTSDGAEVLGPFAKELSG